MDKDKLKLDNITLSRRLIRGKATVTCNECNTTFAVFPERLPDNCPFCKKPINAVVVYSGD